MTDTEFAATQKDVRQGRPFKLSTPKEFKVKIQAYFDSCDPHVETRLVNIGMNQKGDAMFQEREVLTDQVPYAISDLGLALGVSRQTLLNYRNTAHWEKSDISEDDRKEILDTIYDAIQKVEGYNERALHRSGVSRGVIFSLINNFGWQDKKVVDETVRTAKEALDELDDPEKQRAQVAEEAEKALEQQGNPDDPEPGPEAQ